MRRGVGRVVLALVFAVLGGGAWVGSGVRIFRLGRVVPASLVESARSVGEPRRIAAAVSYLCLAPAHL
jgi:hypothetical protein